MPTNEEILETVDALKIRATLKEAGFDRDPEEPEDWSKAAMYLNQKGMVANGRKHWTKRGLLAFLQGHEAFKKKETKKPADTTSKKLVKKVAVAKKPSAKKLRPGGHTATSFKLTVSETADFDGILNEETLTVEYAGIAVVLNYKGPITTDVLSMAKQQFHLIIDNLAAKLKTTK